MMTQNFDMYLANHKSTESKQHTNTRIGDKNLNLFGGSYTIPPEEWKDFMKKYYDYVFVQGKKEYLTEKQLVEDGPILLDFDFRYDSSITTRKHTEDHIIDMIMLYAEKISELVAVRDNVDIDVFVMEKADVNCTVEGKTKDGIHIIFGIKMHKALQVMLRSKILESSLKDMLSDLPLTNDWEDILDEGVTKGSVNWQMYGSRKPGNLAYMMKYHYVLNYTEKIDDWTYKSFPLTEFKLKDNFEKLSARYTDHPGFDLRDHIKADFQEEMERLHMKNKPTNNTVLSGLLTPPPERNNSKQTTEDDDYLDLLFNYIGNEERNGKKIVSYQDRLCIRFVLKSNNYDKQHYINYCNLREGKGKDNAEDDWEKLVIHEITPMYVLEGVAKRVVPAKYKLWLKKRDEKIKLIGKDMLIKSLKENEVQNSSIVDDLDGCDLMKQRYGESIRKCGDTWYVNKPTTTYWCRGAEYVKELIMKSRFTKKVGKFDLPYSSNATGCNNIFKAMEISSDNFPLNKNFVNYINEKTKGKLYFKDKYWDFNEKKWFEIEADNIPLVFIERNAPDFKFTKEEIDDFKKSVLNMFATDNDIDLYLQALSRGLGGYIEDKKFYVMKGLRNSGKGILQEQAFASFGEYCCIYDIPMSKTNYKADASDRRWVLTSQAHIKRIGFTNENAGIAGKVELTIDGNEMKKVIASGGDIFQARGHYADEVDVKFNATTFMSLNNIPISSPADALENMILFDMPFKFVEKDIVAEDTILYREKDTKLKEKIKKNEKWRDIYLYLIFQAFKDSPVEFSNMNESSRAEMIKSTGNAELCNPVKLFNNAFVINDKGWVSTIDVKRILEPAKLTDVKFSKFLKDRGFVQKKGSSISKKDDFGNELKDENGKVKKYQPQGYTGFSFKQEEQVDEDIEEQ